MGGTRWVYHKTTISTTLLVFHCFSNARTRKKLGQLCPLLRSLREKLVALQAKQSWERSLFRYQQPKSAKGPRSRNLAKTWRTKISPIGQNNNPRWQELWLQVCQDFNSRIQVQLHLQSLNSTVSGPPLESNFSQEPRC